MAPKRLLIVTHTFLPHVGGIERVVYEQGKRLLRLGFDVTVLTSRMGTAKNYTYGGLRVECYDSLNIGFSLGIPYSIPQIGSFGTFLKRIHASDIVHAHGHPYLSSLVAAKLAKRYGKPLVVTQHNTFIEYNNLWDRVERLNDLVVGKMVLRAADRIIVVSNATKNYILSLGADPQKTVVLHNGVDLDRFKSLNGTREKTRKKLGIPDNAIVALTVRRLVYKNGIDTLIDTARIAAKRNPNLVFLVVGTGPDFEEIQTKTAQLGIANNLRLTGFVSDEDLPTYYNAADFFILPSKSGEGLPLVALEAMACGLPVIATNVGGIGEIVPESYGKLVPPNNPELTADAVLEFSRKENLSTIKKDLRTIAVQRFSWENNVDRLVETYKQLI